MENVSEEMDEEQTWPTEEELAEAKMMQKRKIVKKVPKGFSEYQAAWIPDVDGGNKSNKKSRKIKNYLKVQHLMN